LLAAVILAVSVYNIHGSFEISKNFGEPTMDYLCRGSPVNETVPAVARTQLKATTADLPPDELHLRQNWALKAKNNFHLDVGVPIRGRDDKMVGFAETLGKAIQEFRAKVQSPQPVDFRLLVTRYPPDDSSPSFQQTLATAAKLESQNVIFVSTNDTAFHRAQAINLLHDHTRHGGKTVLTITDVDMLVGPRFLYNALEKVNDVTIYFPIVFSDYRPSTVLLVEQFLGPQTRYSEHRGLWRGASRMGRMLCCEMLHQLRVLC